MSETRAIAFDHPFYLSKETQKKVNPWERSFVDPQELDKDPWLDSFEPQQKASKQLFPVIEPKAFLPTETESVDFDKPFYMAPQEKLASPLPLTDKPVLPLPELEPLEMELTPIAKAHANQEVLTQTDADLTQMFEGTVNMLGLIWAHIVDDIYKTRQSGHEHTADTLQTYVKKREKINEDFFDNVEKVHENFKTNETWSFLYNVVEFLTISTGLIGGIALISGGQFYPGGQMLAGSALSMGSFALKQMKYDAKYVAALGISGAVMTGWGMNKGLKIESIKNLFQNITKSKFDTDKIFDKLQEVGETALQLSSTLTKYMQLGSQKIQHQLESANNTLGVERLKNRDDIQKTIGGLKMDDLIELSKAASEQMRMKGEIVTRILLGSRM